MSRLVAEEPTAVSRPVAVDREPQPRPARPGQSLFRVIWRWHFFAGLLVSPIVMVAALTGGIYLFGAEIGDAVNHEALFVEGAEAGRKPATAQTIVDNAAVAVPGGRATGLKWHADPRRTVEVTIEPRPIEDGGGPRRGRKATVYVDPYSAEVQAVSGGPLKLSGFFRIVLEIHRQLFLGTTGRIVVELATCWAIVLFLTGVYLWWPRRKEKVRGVWKPRWTAKPYTRLRDLHALAGIYLWPVCMTIFVTGLFYTLLWGEAFHVVSKQVFAVTTATGSAKIEAEAIGVEAAEDESQPRRGGPDHATPAPAADSAVTFSFEQAVAEARTLYPDRDVTVSIPSEPEEHYEASAINDYARGTYGAMHSTGFKLHRRTGAAFDHDDLADNERYWWHAWAYPLHVGSVLGPASKVLWLIACLTLVALPFTGLWMWWKRRPAGRTGFPRETSLVAVSVWLWGAIALLCLLLPAFGLSVALVAGAEWAIARRRVSRSA